MICLDTNVVIVALDRRPSPLKECFDRQVLTRNLALPAVCLIELEYGIAKSPHRDANALRLARLLQLPLQVLPFERDDAREAGLIRAALEAAGTPIGSYPHRRAGEAAPPWSRGTPASSRGCPASRWRTGRGREPEAGRPRRRRVGVLEGVLERQAA